MITWIVVLLMLILMLVVVELIPLIGVALLVYILYRAVSKILDDIHKRK